MSELRLKSNECLASCRLNQAYTPVCLPPPLSLACAPQYLIGATVIAAAWALLMLLLDCISLGRGKLSASHTPKILRIIGDFVSTEQYCTLE